MAHEEGNAGRVWEEVGSSTWQSDDNIRVFEGTPRGGGPWLARGPASTGGVLISHLATSEAAMAAADERWPWKPPVEGRVWEDVTSRRWESSDGICVRRVGHATPGVAGWVAARRWGPNLEGFLSSQEAMAAADAAWRWKAPADPMAHVKHMMQNLQEIGALHQSGLLLRTQLDIIRSPNPGLNWTTIIGAQLDLSPDECAHLDRSWTARLEALDTEIAERTEKLMSTPPRDWGEE